MIEEAKELGAALLVRGKTEDRDGLVQARITRSRYLAMIDERVSRVRRVARYVFRASPEIVREVTSAHARERRRAERRRGEDAQPVEPEPAEDESVEDETEE